MVQQVEKVHADTEYQPFFYPARSFGDVSFPGIREKKIARNAKEGGGGYADDRKQGFLVAERGMPRDNQKGHEGFAQVQRLNNLPFVVILCQRGHAARAV
ncbi:MAG: hypothetical protein IKJ58_04550 [Akkermansia sp.]|nr:hypothetical protein [Akkermansia sp.]